MVQRLMRILETVLYVDDLAVAKRFYEDVLGLELDSAKPDTFAFFRLDEAMLLLFVAEASLRNKGVPPHGSVGPGHACFAIAEVELEPWAMRLQQAGVVVERWQDWPRGGRSFYFRDPAGNSLEFASPRIWGLSERADPR